MLSGGGDSVCLLDVAVRLGARGRPCTSTTACARAPTRTRASAPICASGSRCRLWSSGSTFPRAATSRSGRATPATFAERHAEGDYAAAHTATDQAETVLYRLAVSPGRRPLLGMEARRGRLVRPLLGVTRSEVRDYLRDRRLDWREDLSNADRRFARARVRHDVLDAAHARPGRGGDDRGDGPPAARRGGGARRGGRGRARVPGGRAGGAAGRPPGSAGRPGAPGPARAGRPHSRAETDAILALGERGGTKSLDLGGGGRWPSTGPSASAAIPTPPCPSPWSSRCREAPASARGR